MNELKCPNCKSNLALVKEPDIEYEKCPNCKGIFLDKDELNLFATGRSVNIELSSSISDYQDDIKRICPKCRLDMQKAQLFNMSGIYFNFCDKCLGFFLDNLTDKRINNYLQNTTKDKHPEEFRGYINDILVRVDIERGNSAIYVSGYKISNTYTPQNILVITAYYSRSLNLDLFITPESIFFRIAKLLFNNNFKEAYSGNIRFDKYFKILCNNEYKFQSYFSNIITNLIMDYIQTSPKVYNKLGNLYFYDDRVEYREGTYIDIPSYQENDKFENVFYNLVDIVKLIK